LIFVGKTITFSKERKQQTEKLQHQPHNGVKSRELKGTAFHKNWCQASNTLAVENCLRNATKFTAYRFQYMLLHLTRTLLSYRVLSTKPK